MKRTGWIAALVAVAGAAGVGVAGANQLADGQVYAREGNGPCFSINSGATDCTTNESAEVSINTGEKVTWNFTGTTGHNAAASNDVPADPAWKDYVGEFNPPTGSYSYTFTQPGDYTFVCQAHQAQMHGVIHVTGDPTGTPTSTATSTPTPTPTKSPQPGGGTTTPPPSGGTDTVKPTVNKLKLKALRHAARVTFKLSEASTITIRVKRGKKLLVSKRLQAPAGTRTVTVRSRKLKKGRYTIEILARDAVGNRSVAARKTLRLRR
jgi:plastocyanin